MHWLAALTVLVVVLATLAVARALRASPYNVAGGLVLVVSTLAWLALVLPQTRLLPHAFNEGFAVASNLAGVGVCIFAFTRRLIWPVLPLLYFVSMLLIFWAWQSGPPRLF